MLLKLRKYKRENTYTYYLLYYLYIYRIYTAMMRRLAHEWSHDRGNNMGTACPIVF